MINCAARVAVLILLASFSSLLSVDAHAAPSAAVAKKCLSYAYRAYPYKRPGAAKASNGRQLYFTDCLSKNGEVDEPSAASQIANDGKPNNSN